MSIKFSELSDMVFSIAEKVTDNEYKNIMDKMLEIRNIYVKDKIIREQICECSEYMMCTSSLEDMIKCKNLPIIIRHIPELKTLFLTMDELFNEDEPRRLQFEPIGLDIELTREDKFKHAKLIRNMIDINSDSGTNGKITKTLSAIALMDYMFRNFGFLNIMPNLKLSVYNKLSTFVEETSELQFVMIKNIYNLEENPFEIWKRNMKPYMDIKEND
jgi:hypothetical protein